MRNPFRINKINIKWILFVLLALFLGGCSEAPPDHTENICLIFKQYPEWYWYASDARADWGIPISVLMSIIYQESSFKSTAKPPRQKFLWIIPWKRPTTASGYSQAVNNTWMLYKQKTYNKQASRDAFGDAADFIGWYSTLAKKKLHIKKTDAYSLYLAYHEGIGGYANKTYKQKPWLMATARRVEQRAKIYRKQLSRCEAYLPKKPWWHVW